MLAFDSVAAVPAMPGNGFVPLKHGAIFDMLRQVPVPGFVEFFHLGDLLERRGNLLETLLGGHFGKILIHGGPLVIFAFGRGQQVAQGIPQVKGITGHDFGGAFLQVFEEDLGVLFFIFRSLLKNSGNQLIACLFGFAGIVGIAVPGLGLPGKGDEQVFFRFGNLAAP
jgi:hypothetical protein